MWTKFKKFWSDVFTDINGNYSSKRVVTLTCAVLMVIGYLCDLIIDLSVPQFMYEAVTYIVIAGLGFTGAEQFAKNKNGVTGSSSSGSGE